jgi:hypothetical protein
VQDILLDYVTCAACAETISAMEAKGTLIFCLKLVLPHALGEPVSHENRIFLLKKLEPIAIEKIFLHRWVFGLRGYSSKRARYGFPQRITISNGQIPSTKLSGTREYVQFQIVPCMTTGLCHVTSPYYCLLCSNLPHVYECECEMRERDF